MKQYTIRTVVGEEIITETKLEMSEGSILIQHLPEDFTYEQAERCHKMLQGVLENGGQLITLAPETKLQVLEFR